MPVVHETRKTIEITHVHTLVGVITIIMVTMGTLFIPMSHIPIYMGLCSMVTSLLEETLLYLYVQISDLLVLRSRVSSRPIGNFEFSER